jgi:predicted ATP-dependent protease
MDRASAERSSLVPSEKLRIRCDPKQFSFATTDELKDLDELIGQDRALGAIRFGTAIAKPGFNLYLLGAAGTGRHTAIRQHLERKAARERKPDDWVYVNNFEQSHKPNALKLPTGTAIRFGNEMAELIDDLKAALPALFESEDYRSRRRAIDEGFEEQQSAAFDELRKKAEAQEVAILRAPMGFALAPVKDGKVIKPEEFGALPVAEREAIEAKIQTLQKDLEKSVQGLPRLEKERRERVRALDAELAEFAVASAIEALQREFAGIEPIAAHLGAVRADLIKNAQLFLQAAQEAGENPALVRAALRSDDPRFRRYAVNVLVGDEPSGDGAAKGATIVFEDHPTLFNLIGRVEHQSQMGALITDFTLIKPGALHRANGGYLVLEVRKLLSEPLAYEALKRCLRSRTISIVSAGEQLSLISTVSLEPDPIPLEVKVILLGDRVLHLLLLSADPDFPELFKVEADFNEEIEWTAENAELYARLVATLARRRGLKPLDASGVARVIEEASRSTADAERLSVRTGPLADLLTEADFWAGENARSTIASQDVARAVAERTRRADRMRERSHEAITRRILLIDTEGERIGQINGLSVAALGTFAFGRPTRITARVRMGAGKVVDIEREVELGGPLHSKGVLILSSFLAAHYALDVPMSLWASLVFEQSYGGIDGDSASSAELYALLSALAEVPIRQSLAVTGSVNQLGEVQAIGGVNEKVEGFFDVCRARGLTGDQGVLIPLANRKHLMLREDVIEAAAAGRFHVHSVDTIAQGIEILTGVPAGVRDGEGRYPEGSVNARVEARLREFAETRRKFGETRGERNGSREDGT